MIDKDTFIELAANAADAPGVNMATEPDAGTMRWAVCISQAAYKLGLEDAAKVCEDKAKETFSAQCQTWGDYFATAIRKLEEQHE